MDINHFTAKAQEAITHAETLATRYGHQQVDVEHLLVALLDQKGGLAVGLLNRAQVDVDKLTQRADQGLESRPEISGPGAASGQIFLTERHNRVLNQAQSEADKLKDKFVSVEHLILALIDAGESKALAGDSAAALLHR